MGQPVKQGGIVIKKEDYLLLNVQQQVKQKRNRYKKRRLSAPQRCGAVKIE
jgi:hypothetical protein